MPMQAADINEALARKAQADIQREALHEELSVRKTERAVQYLSLETGRCAKTSEAANEYLHAFFKHATTQVPKGEPEVDDGFPVPSTA